MRYDDWTLLCVSTYRWEARSAAAHWLNWKGFAFGFSGDSQLFNGSLGLFSRQLWSFESAHVIAHSLCCVSYPSVIRWRVGRSPAHV